LSGATPEAVLTEPQHPDNPHPMTMLTARQHQAPGAVVIVELRGEVDLATEQVMQAALAGAAATAGLRLLVCDLTQVSFFSCGGLAVLLRVQTALKPRGARMRVVARSPTVILLFEVARLDDTLGLCASVREAIHGPR
jgi:anti-anti-sigma factor